MEKLYPLKPTQQFYPAHISKDREFGGNGPEVYATVDIFPVGSKIYATYTARFLETGGGGTLFDGADTEELIDVKKEIKSIRLGADASWESMLSDDISFTDKDTSENVVVGRRGGLVNRARIQGDTNSGLFSGNDDPFIQFFFNPIRILTVD
ncbi:MAG: hypothetical protein AABY61_01745 [Nitrospirota bacterium]